MKNKDNKIMILEYIEDKISDGGFAGGFFIGLGVMLCIALSLLPIALALSFSAWWPLWLWVVFVPVIVGITTWLGEATW